MLGKDDKYDQEAFDRGEWQVMADENSLGLNAHGIAMVHKNNPKTTRINKFGSLCLKEEFFNFLLHGLPFFGNSQVGKNKPVDNDYL